MTKHHEKTLFFGLGVNFVFFLVELAGGLYSNSIAVISDALHDFTDVVSLFFSWWVERLSGRKTGRQKLRVAVAFANAHALIVGSLYLIYEAIGRLKNPEPVESWMVIGLSILGVAFNSSILLRLWKSEGKNINIKVMILHYLEDVLGWVSILAGGIVMYLTNLYWIDSVLTMLYSAVILSLAVKMVISIVKSYEEIW